MGLTVREKEECRDAIRRRIKRRVEALKEEHSDEIRALEAAALGQALDALGIRTLHHRIEQLRKQEVEATKRAERLKQSRLHLTRQALGKTRTDAGGISEYNLDGDLSRLLSQEKDRHYKVSLAASNALPFLQELRRLDTEMQHLSDTVWLATSAIQVKELWKRVGILLGEEDTALQKDALSIPPVEQ